MSYCEDYPACGHTPQDPCERQWYDEPGAFDPTKNPHCFCNHEEGDCEVDYDEDYDEDDLDEGVDPISLFGGHIWSSDDIPDNPDDNGMRDSDFI